MGKPKICLVGEKFKNTQGFEYEIIEVLPNSKRRIKFTESNYERISETKEVINGKILDKNREIINTYDDSDLIGLKIGMITIIKNIGKVDNVQSYECRCDCGNITTKKLFTIRSAIRKGSKISCGCGKIKDLKGMKFGKLTAEKYIGLNAHKGAMWECICECGNTRTASADHLKHGGVTRCETCPKSENITGNTYGRLKVLEYINDGAKWLCECECGNEKITTYSDLESGKVKSCGCLQHDTHNNMTHGLSNTRLYTIYGGMKQRCYYEPSNHYHIYGGKGVVICDEWLNDFEVFYNWAMSNGYQDDLTIDRINSDGNYEPNNCRWATNLEQANNTNKNVNITYRNETKTMAQWSKELNINYSSLRSYCQKYGADEAPKYIDEKLEELQWEF